MRLLDDLPVSLMVYRPDGLLCAMNHQAEVLWLTGREAIVGVFNVLEDPQSVAQNSQAYFEQALAGETVLNEAVPYDTSQVEVERRGDRRLWVQARLFPLRDETGAVSHVVIMHQDVTDQVANREVITQAQDQIANQRAAIDTLASPIIQVWEGILTVPLVGMLDARRAMYVTERLLEAIVEYQADVVIFDITGVRMVDTQVASSLLQAARAIRLLGCRPALVGLSAEVAQTMVQLGIEFDQLATLANLREGLNWAFGLLGLQVTAKTSLGQL
ncbi:MAG: STAS domain-containing protein [Oscillochloridaceae bacterium umkhey_bin13]